MAIENGGFMLEKRLFGPPGTGKTTTISTLVSESAKKYGSDAVLVSSFTRASASELVSRNLPIDKEHIGTLHAHCFRSLGRPVIADSKIKEWNELHPSYAMSGNKDYIDDLGMELAGTTLGDKLYNDMSRLRATMKYKDIWPISTQAFAGKWNAWKKENDYMDFTDLLETAVRDIYFPPYNTSVGFFDEVQDFTPLELFLVRKWAEKMEHVTMAGDDDQCIYSFKGSRPESFLNPPLPDERIEVFSKTYGIPKEI